MVVYAFSFVDPAGALYFHLTEISDFVFPLLSNKDLDICFSSVNYDMMERFYLFSFCLPIFFLGNYFILFSI